MKTKITLIAGLVMFMVTMGNLNLKAQYLFQDTYAPNTFAYITECAAPTDNSNRLFVVQQRGLIYILNTAVPSTAKKLSLI